MSNSANKSRVIARKVARELTPREVEHVAGGGGGNTQDGSGAWSDTNYN
jgi:hypothetical protein